MHMISRSLHDLQLCVEAFGRRACGTFVWQTCRARLSALAILETPGIPFSIRLVMYTPNPPSLGGCPKFPVNFVTQQRLQCQIRCNRASRCNSQRNAKSARRPRICNRALTAPNGHPKSTLQRTVALCGHARYLDLRFFVLKTEGMADGMGVLKPAPASQTGIPTICLNDFRPLL